MGREGVQVQRPALPDELDWLSLTVLQTPGTNPTGPGSQCAGACAGQVMGTPVAQGGREPLSVGGASHSCLLAAVPEHQAPQGSGSTVPLGDDGRAKHLGHQPRAGC